MRVRQSEITRFQRCRRAWFLGYQMQLVPRRGDGRRMPASGQRDTGSAYHKGVEAIHEDLGIELAQEAVAAYIESTRRIGLPEGEEPPPLTKQDDPLWWEAWRMASVMLDGYVDWLQDTGHEAGMTTEQVEWKWEFPLPEAGDGVTVYGQVDLLMRDSLRGEGLVLDDVKSVADFSVCPTPVDFQLRTYALAVRETMGETPVSIGHRRARRVLRTAKAKPPFYDRYPIPVNDQILDAHKKHLTTRVVDIIWAKQYATEPEHEALYPNPTKDCSWDCDFKDICPMVDEGDDWQHIVARDYDVKTEETA